MATYTDAYAVVEQLQLLRLFLERPVIQAQLAALAGVVLIAGGVSLGVWKVAGTRLVKWGAEHLKERWRASWQHGFTLVRYLLFPLCCLLAGYIMFRIFLAQGWHYAFMNRLGILFWVFLGYRLVVALLYLILGTDYMSRYHTPLLTPFFGLFIANWLLSQFLDLSILTRFVVFQPFGKPITAGSLFVAPVTLYFLLYTSRAIQDLLQGIIIPKTSADPHIIQAVLTISRYVVIAIGITIIAVSLGANMSTLAFISGGLSVGIGFGLQQIVANFLSGILLLFERTIRPGDVIDVNGDMGVVEQLSIRSTTMRTPNNIQVIVPNETLLTSAVTTYTKSNRLVRIVIPVGVSYDSDPQQVRELLIGVAQQHQSVREEPKPVAFFRDFGDSSLDFQLAVWLDEPMLAPKITSELRFLIWETFAEHKIEIPFPQRDLHIRYNGHSNSLPKVSAEISPDNRPSR